MCVSKQLLIDFTCSRFENVLSTLTRHPAGATDSMFTYLYQQTDTISTHKIVVVNLNWPAVGGIHTTHPILRRAVFG